MCEYLIIGASGFLGSFLYNSLNEKGIIVEGTCFKNKKKDLHYLDLRNFNSIYDIIKNVDPTTIIHTGGLTNTDYCEKNPEEAFSVNVESTKKILSRFDGRVVYFSTDYVFNGETGNYNEDSLADPINYYGFTKRLAEQEVLKNKDNLVVRVSGLYGNNPFNNKFLSGLNKNEIEVYDNLISSPTYINDVVKEMDRLMSLKGIIHFTGPEAFSRYDFAMKIVNGLKLTTKVIANRYNPLKTTAKRPFKSNLLTKYNFFNMTYLDNALVEMQKSK